MDRYYLWQSISLPKEYSAISKNICISNITKRIDERKNLKSVFWEAKHL
jgi:hypothetical protein